MHTSFKYLIPAFMALTLAACGGSSSSSDDANDAEYSGKTSPADLSSLTQDKKKTIAKETGEVLINVMKSSSAKTEDISPEDVMPIPTGVTQSTTSSAKISAQQAVDLSVLITKKQKSTHLPLGIASESTFNDLCTSGSAKETESGNENKGSFKFVFKKCEIDFNKLLEGEETADLGFTFDMVFVFDGSMSASWTPSSFKMDYKNYSMTITSEGETDVMKMNGFYHVNGVNFYDDSFNEATSSYTAKWNLATTIDKETFTSAGEISCNNSVCKTSTTVKAASGKSYKVEDLKVDENTNGDDTVSGKFYHPEEGSYTIEAIIKKDCELDDLSPFVGTATIKDDAGNTINYESQACGNEPSIT